MEEFHISNWEDKLIIANKFKEERNYYFAEKLIFEENPSVLPKNIISKINRRIAKKIFSHNDEKWNTIPRTYSEIDTLRAKFEKENQLEKLVILDEINAYVEELEKTYLKV